MPQRLWLLLLVVVVSAGVVGVVFAVINLDPEHRRLDFMPYTAIVLAALPPAAIQLIIKLRRRIMSYWWLLGLGYGWWVAISAGFMGTMIVERGASIKVWEGVGIIAGVGFGYTAIFGLLVWLAFQRRGAKPELLDNMDE